MLTNNIIKGTATTLKEMAIHCVKLKINPSKQSGDLQLSITKILKVDVDKNPENWRVFDAESGDMVGQETVQGAGRVIMDKFVNKYRKVAAGESKDPTDHLKDSGFYSDAEKQQYLDGHGPKPARIKEATNTLTGNAEPDSRKQTELDAKLEEMERIVSEKQDTADKKTLEMNQREKGTEALQQLPAMKQGGYTAKVREVESKNTGHFVSVPVKKLSRTIRGLTPRLAECGKIKIGKKGEKKISLSGTHFRQPEKIDHFIVTTMEKENDDFVQDVYIMNKMGENCKSIPVRLPYDDPSLNFPTSYAYYESAACNCRGDGETAINIDGEHVDCYPDTCQNIKDKKCKPNGVLSLILDDAPRVGGVYKLRTTGWNSINNIFSSMEFIRGLTGGLLAGLPLMLTLTPKYTVIPGTKTSTIIYMVNLEYRGSLQEMATAIQQTISTRALMQYSIKDFEKFAEEAQAAPEAPDECRAIVEEFYPEAMV